MPLSYALGPYSSAAFFGATHALDLTRRLKNRGGRHRLGLHSAIPPAARGWRFPATRSGPAPDFALAGLDGGPGSLSQLRGSVVLLNVWASWCEPCRRVLPQLQRLHERHSAADLVVLGVSHEDPGPARQYLEELGVGYPSLRDVDGSVMQNYRIHAIPTSLIIGRDDRLLKRMESYAPAGAFEHALKPLLSHVVRGSGP